MKGIYFITPYNSSEWEGGGVGGSSQTLPWPRLSPSRFLWGCLSPASVIYFWRILTIFYAAASGPQCKVNHRTPWPCQDGWSRTVHVIWGGSFRENTLELWCLQSFLSLLEMPSGYKTLWQVAWIPSLGVEALMKKVLRLWPSKKRGWNSEGVKQRTNDFWFFGSSHWDLCICSESCVLDSQNHFNEPHLFLKPVGGGLLSTVIQTLF